MGKCPPLRENAPPPKSDFPLKLRLSYRAIFQLFGPAFLKTHLYYWQKRQKSSVYYMHNLRNIDFLGIVYSKLSLQRNVFQGFESFIILKTHLDYPPQKSK